MTATDGDAATPGRRERNKAETRRRIVVAGRRLFAAQGFDATTTGALAREAGIGAGTLYNYVNGKDDLLVEVFREDAGEAWDAAFAANDATTPVLAQLMSIFTDVSTFHERDRGVSRAFFKELNFVSPSVGLAVTELMAGIYARLEALLRNAQAGGRLVADVPVGPLAHNLFSLWYLLMQQRHADTLGLDDALRHLRRAFEVALWRLVPDG